MKPSGPARVNAVRPRGLGQATMFLLYALSCTLCMVAYHKHPKFGVVQHMAIPLFGLCANLACMGFFLVGPFMGYGTKVKPCKAVLIESRPTSA